MPIPGVTHEEDGTRIKHISPKYKVSLGLPRGYQMSDGTELSAPVKAFNFIIQRRGENGTWEMDREKMRSLMDKDVDLTDPPLEGNVLRDLPIQLVANTIDEMVRSDLFYWDNQAGSKCSCGTLDYYLKQWCQKRNIAWEPPLSTVRSQIEMETLIDEGKIPERLKEFLEFAETFAENYNKRMAHYSSYEVGVEDVIHSRVATRLRKGEYKPFPCLFRKCPDYFFEDCNINGRFFFAFQGSDMGEIAHLVTTSPKIIQNIQFGLEDLIKPHAEHGLYGVRCRLVGQPERGTFTNDEGYQQKSSFFRTYIDGPSRNNRRSQEMIAEDSHEMARKYSGAPIVFDEGDEEQLAAERLNEFTDEIEIEKKKERVMALKEKEEASKGNQTRGSFKLDDESRSPSRGKQPEAEKRLREKAEEKSEEDLEFRAHIESLFEDAWQDADAVFREMVLVLAAELDRLKKSNAVRKLKKAIESALVDQSLTMDKVLDAQEYIKNRGSQLNLKEKLEEVRAKIEPEKNEEDLSEGSPEETESDEEITEELEDETTDAEEK